MRLSVTILAVCLLASTVAAEPKYGPQSKQEAAKLVAVVQSADADLHAKNQACRKLAVIGSADIADDLAPLLADEKLSHMIRYALEPIPGAAVDKAFRDALGKLQGEPLVGVINSVGVRRDAKAVDALTKRLKGDDVDAACAAAGSLGRIATDPAAAALAQARKSAKPGAMRRAVIDGSLDLAGQWARAGKANAAAGVYEELYRSAGLTYARVGAFTGLLVARPDQAVELIVAALSDKDRVIRATAIIHAATAKGPGVTERLAKALPGLPTGTRAMLIAALAERHDAAALPALKTAAAGDDAEVRRAGVAALGKVGDTTCVPVLTKALAQADLAEAATDSLRLLKGDGVDAAIVRAMTDADPAVSAILIEILADRKAATATTDILAQARAEDAAIRLASIKALGRVAGPEHLPAILKILVAADADPARAEAIRTVVLVCRRTPDQSAQANRVIDALAGARTTGEKTVLIEALGSIGGAKARKAVTDSLADRNSAVHDSAVRALAAWPDASAVEAVLDLLGETTNKTHRTLLLRGAIRMLGDSGRGTGEVVGICKGLMAKARSAADRKLLLGALGQVADPAALEAISPLLADKAVQAEAELAMLAVAGKIVGSHRGLAEGAAKKLVATASNEAVRRRARTILNRLRRYADYVTAWRYAGPYAMDGKGASELFALELGPEKGDKDVKWTPIAPSGLRYTPWMFNLGDGANQACYVRTFIHSDKAQPVRLLFGTDDGCKLWVGGKKVFSHAEGGAATPDKFKVAVTLAKGWNEVLLKVVQDTGPWQFCLRIAAPDGKPIKGLRIQAEPPK